MNKNENEKKYSLIYYRNANDYASKKSYRKFKLLEKKKNKKNNNIFFYIVKNEVKNENENEVENEVENENENIFYYDSNKNKVYYLRDYILGSYDTYSYVFNEVYNEDIINNILNTSVMKEIFYSVMV